MKELLAQRINRIALDYEDLNDHNRVRLHPVHALLAGKVDLIGEKRARKEVLAKGDNPHFVVNNPPAEGFA